MCVGVCVSAGARACTVAHANVKTSACFSPFFFCILNFDFFFHSFASPSVVCFFFFSASLIYINRNIFDIASLCTSVFIRLFVFLSIFYISYFGIFNSIQVFFFVTLHFALRLLKLGFIGEITFIKFTNVSVLLQIALIVCSTQHQPTYISAHLL